MLNDYSSREHKLYSAKTSVSIKAQDNKNKIATISLQFAPAMNMPGGGKGKAGDWAKGLDFQLDDTTELVEFGLMFCGRKHEVNFPYHNNKTLLVKRNSNGSMFMSLSAPNKNFTIIANSTDFFHILILICKALGNQYDISELDALHFLRAMPLPQMQLPQQEVEPLHSQQENNRFNQRSHQTNFPNQ